MDKQISYMTLIAVRALDHASRVPQLMSCNYCVCVCVCVHMHACVHTCMLWLCSEMKNKYRMHVHMYTHTFVVNSKSYKMHYVVAVC